MSILEYINIEEPRIVLYTINGDIFCKYYCYGKIRKVIVANSTKYLKHKLILVEKKDFMIRKICKLIVKI